MNQELRLGNYYKNVLVLFLFTFYSNVPAKAQQFVFDHLTIEEGLSQSTVFSINQDAEGFLWFATRDGLNRFDSRNIEVFRHDPKVKASLSDNTIYSLYSDKRGRLWVGTRLGLDLYSPQTGNFSHFYTDSENEKTISNNTITSIVEDSYQNLWIGTRHGLNLLPGGVADSTAFTRFVHDSNNINSLVSDDVRTIFEDNEGVLWVGTTEGLSSLRFKNEKEFSFHSYLVSGPFKHKEKNNWVNTILDYSNGLLLIGTEKHGLKLFDKRKKEFIDVPWTDTDLGSKAVRTILKDPSGNYWIGTIGGLFIIDPLSLEIKKLSNAPDNPYSISDNSIRSIFIDKVGSYWIGTFHGGVNVYSPLAKQFQYLKPGTEGRFKLRFKVAGALVTDRHKNMWMATEGNGLLYIDRKENKTEYFQHDEKNINSLSHDNIKCLLLEEDKGLWVGTIKGLDFFDFKQKRFRHFTLRTPKGEIISDDAVYTVMKDKDGSLWVGTYRGGLLRFNHSENSFDKSYAFDDQDASSISANAVTALFTDSKDNLWVGTALGLNKKVRGQDRFTRFIHNVADSTTIRGEYIHCLFEDSKKRLWIGTRDHGLSMLYNDKSFINFSTKHGLPGTSVYGIVEDAGGYLWVSTENGIARFDAKSQTFKNYDRNDGLICKEFNFNSYHKDADGFIYFGGYNGVIFFHPDNIKGNNVVPSLVFTKLKLFNREVLPKDEKDAVLKQRLNYTKELEFRHDQNVFSVEYAVLNYVNAQKNKFAYKLEGFEKEWNYVKEPVATYMNLRAGVYTLWMKGANNDGIWNEEPLALKLRILPPPWKTWWAYTLYILIFFSLFFAWSRLNKKQVRLEHDLQLEHLEKNKQEELHQAKLNFFTNIAHEIRTPLTLMVGPIDQLHNRLRQDAFLKKEIGLVKSNSDRLMRLLNQLLDFHKQETGNVKLKVRKENFVALIHEIIYPFQEFAESRKIALHLDITECDTPLWCDRDELAKVFYNLLVNAFKFTPGGGQVNIRVSKEYEKGLLQEPSYINVVIEDNGLGIPSHQLKNIFHRFYQAENTGMQEAGFGIGLALAKGIIELHHGEIKVESQEATHDIQGYTRFSVLLKGGNSHFTTDQLYVEEILSHPELEAHNSGSEVPGNSNYSEYDPVDKCVILVVEDNDEIRSYICDTLTQHHYEVLEARNGQEGWLKAIEKLPNLILSDVMMSVMNGLDMVTKIKSDARTSHIPIILLTARASLNHQVEGLVTGADDYLTKPFNVQLLLVKIKNHLAIREKLKEKYSRIVTLNPQTEEIEDPDDKFLRKLMNLLEVNLLDPEFNVTKLASEIGMSRPVLFRKTKMLTGLSVIDLIRSVRLKKAEMLLRQRKLTVSEVAFAVGFNDPKYFSKTFREQYGKSPTQFMEELN